MADPGNFLARWSRLKLQARQSQAPEEVALPQRATPAETPAAELPPVESLTAGSDYTVFMQPGVPEAVRNAALQKLWRSDPVLANLDGLVEYGEDYAAAFTASSAVRTAYRVAQGMTDNEQSPSVGAVQTPSSKTPPADEPIGTAGSADQPANPGSDVHQDRDQGWTDT